MGQDRKRGAGKQKHNHAKYRVLILRRHTRSLPRFGGFGGSERFFILQLFHFSFVLNRIVHLPVPSENLSRRGNEISESTIKYLILPRTRRDMGRSFSVFQPPCKALESTLP